MAFTTIDADPYSQGFAIVGASSEQHHWNQYQHKEQHQ
jgi:hypothetical protein